MESQRSLRNLGRRQMSFLTLTRAAEDLFFIAKSFHFLWDWKDESHSFPTVITIPSCSSFTERNIRKGQGLCRDTPCSFAQDQIDIGGHPSCAARSLSRSRSTKCIFHTVEEFSVSARLDLTGAKTCL